MEWHSLQQDSHLEMIRGRQQEFYHTVHRKALSSHKQEIIIITKHFQMAYYPSNKTYRQYSNFYIQKMCQCNACGCCWCNLFKVCCLGLSCHLFCCSIWCCKPEEFESFNYNCITCCEKSGLGGVTCLGIGMVCCSPEWLIKYSEKKSSTGKKRDSEY